MAHAGSAAQPASSLEGLGGAAPESFLVFIAVEQVSKIYGKTEAAEMLRESAAAFVRTTMTMHGRAGICYLLYVAATCWLIPNCVLQNERMLPEFKAERHFGAEATQQVWTDIVANKADPKVGPAPSPSRPSSSSCLLTRCSSKVP